MSIIFIVTDAGRTALVNAANTGTDPVTITQMGVSNAVIVPSAVATVLPAEIKRIAAVSGDVVADDTIHLIARDESADAYSVRSLALYLGDGTLFAIYGQADGLTVKTAQSILMLAIDIRFADVAATLLTFGDANFLNPPATTTARGVIELATEAEVLAGTDAVRAVTPKDMKTATSTLAPVPVGQIVIGLWTATPAGFLKCNGALAARSTFAALFAAIGTTYGAGNGTTTFNLPDFRGEFPRFWDDGRGIDPGRTIGSAQGHQLQDHRHRYEQAIQAFQKSLYPVGDTSGDYFPQAGVNFFIDNWPGTSDPVTGSHGAETRPRNVALFACIRY